MTLHSVKQFLYTSILFIFLLPFYNRYLKVCDMAKIRQSDKAEHSFNL